MAEETPGQNNTPVETPQEAPVPSVEQQVSDAPVEAKPQQSELPTDNERTKREFEKLREQLREERARRQYVESTFSQYKQPKATETPIAPVIDPDTGLINEQALSAAQQAAMEAKREAEATRQQWQQYMQDVEAREAYAAHPELNPSDSTKFDRELHKATRRIILDSMLNPDDYDGKQLSLKEAGDLAKGAIQSKDAIETAKREGATQALEQLTPKEQATLEATGSATRRQDALSDIESLRQATRKGNTDALAERLKRATG